MSWDTPFPEPIAIAGRKHLLTLRDAAVMIQGLPKAEADQPAWQTAMHVLLQAADHGGPVSFARIGVMQALKPNGDPTYDPNRKDPHWGRGKLARDR